jgi:hypothetical protein
MNFNRFKKIDDISIKNRYEEAKSLYMYCQSTTPWLKT